MKTTTSLGSKVLVLGLLLWAFNAVSVFAAEEHGNKADAQEEKAEKTVIPKTLPAIWSAVEGHQKELHSVLSNNKLDDVHHHAFAIRDLVAAMPGKSDSLTTQEKAKLKKATSRVASLAKLLDEAGDGGDSAKVATLTVKLDGELKSIQELYPVGYLMSTKSKADASDQIYACPMHPEVTSDKPGKCYKCGMKLVLKTSIKSSTPVQSK